MMYQINNNDKIAKPDQQIYEYLELKQMKRIGMYFYTNNYFEKYLQHSLNTLDYLNVSFDSDQVRVDFSCLQKLTNLRKFKIHKATPTQIANIFAHLNCKSLKTLHFGKQCEYDDNAMSSLIKSDLSQLINFKYYNWDNNQSNLIQSFFRQSKTIVNITKLCLKAYLSPECCKLISQKVKKLQICKLSYCFMNDACAAELKGLTNIYFLTLNSNVITDDGLKPIYENLKNIRIIKLNNSDRITFKGLYHLSSHLKKLEYIEYKNLMSSVNYYQAKTELNKQSIVNAQAKSDGYTFIDVLCQTQNVHCLRLAQFHEECILGENHFYRIRPVTPEQIKSIAVLKLAEIDLSDIKEEYLVHFLAAKGCSDATRIVLNPKINQISDEIAQSLVSAKYKQLQYISLSNCYNVSSKTILILLQNKSLQKTIKEIYLNKTEFDDSCAQFLINFITLLPNLNTISVKNCFDDLSDTQLSNFKTKMLLHKVTLLT